jgi:hypothetical protein
VSETAALGRLFQGTDSLVPLAHGRLAVVGMALFEIIADVLKVSSGGRRPADTHS